jgi:GAF domain-containing protein
MTETFKTWLKPRSTDPNTAQREYILNIVLVCLAGLCFLFGILSLLLWTLNRASVVGSVLGLGCQPFYLLSYVLGRRGRVTAAAHLTAFVVYLLMSLSALLIGVGYVTTIGLAAVVIIAGILISTRSAVVFILLSVATYTFASFTQAAGVAPTTPPSIPAVIANALGLGLGLLALMMLTWLSNRETANTLARQHAEVDMLKARSLDLEEQVAERTHELQKQALQLQTTADIAKLSTEMTEPEELMSRSVELIRERFGFYHASVFMMDEMRTWAVLTASTGEAGQRMLARRHRLALGSASVIGWVTANRQPRVVLDVDQDPFHFKNPLLPGTRAEMAVPLLIGQQLLGALDVQSTELNAFSEADVRTLEAIASELAFAIDSARKQDEMRKRLERLDSSYRDQASVAWDRLIRSGIQTIFRIGSQGRPEEPVETGFTTLNDALQQAATVVNPESNEIAVPVIVRGEVVATIAARKPAGGEEWSADETALLEAVASQSALSLENARQRADEQRHVAELEVINRVSQAVSQMLHIASLYRVVHSQINQVFGETDMYIALYHADEGQISFPYSSEQEGDTPLPNLQLGKDLTSHIIQTQQPLLLVDEVEQRASRLGVSQVGGAAKSWMGVPMMVGEDVLGVIAVKDLEQEHRFSDDDLALLTTIASQIAAAIQNARLIDRIQRAERRERLIREITSKVRRSADIKTILDTTAREVAQALNAARTTVRLEKGTLSEGPGDAGIQYGQDNPRSHKEQDA